MKSSIEKVINFKDIYESNLIVGALYKGGNSGNMSDEVLSKLMMCENSGGFRKRGSINPFDLKYVVLYSTNKNENWINKIDFQNKRVYYYGDNTKNEVDMLDTKKKGNLILKNVYDRLNNSDRKDIPPFFMFTSEQGRDVRFIGLLVPGDDRLSKEEQLTKVVNEVEGKQIENYKAVFTILDVKEIDRRWIEDLNDGEKNSKYAPDEWNKWKNNNLENLQSKTIIESNLSSKENEEEIKINKDKSPYEKEIISIPASKTTDLIYKYRIHAHPVDGNYPYKKSLYYTFREKGGYMKSLYTLKGTVELYPNKIDSIKFIEDDEITNRIKGYIEERSKSFGFSNKNKYKFYILEDKIELPNEIKIPGQNNHSYITISEAYSGNEELKHDNKNKKTIKRNKKVFSEPEVSDFEEIYGDYRFIEGEEYIKIEKRKKRSSCIRKLKINFAKKQLGQAMCEICGENDEVVLDVHHEKIMVSDMEENHVTKLSDLRILCANCHRRAHKYKLKVEDLKKMLNFNSVIK